MGLLYMRDFVTNKRMSSGNRGTKDTQYGETIMRDPNRKSDEVAANLLDKIQMDTELFIDESAQEAEQEISAHIQEQAPAPLPLIQRISIPVATKPEHAAKPVKVGGFSALLDHLKAEALRHDQRSKAEQSLRSAA
jgi:hypothetical protein